MCKDLMPVWFRKIKDQLMLVAVVSGDLDRSACNKAISAEELKGKMLDNSQKLLLNISILTELVNISVDEDNEVPEWLLEVIENQVPSVKDIMTKILGKGKCCE